MSISTAIRGASRSLRRHFHSASFADEIYAGHVAEHVDDVKASLGRWFKVLKPGGRITITVPDCRGEIECGWNENVFPPWS